MVRFDLQWTLAHQGLLSLTQYNTVQLKAYLHIKYIKVSLTQYNAVQLNPYLHIKDMKTIYNKWVFI